MRVSPLRGYAASDRTRKKRGPTSTPRKPLPELAPRSTARPGAEAASTHAKRAAPVQLTPAQQQLDEALRAWRKAESEKIGLPQFFVLGSSTLRSIVMERPRTLSQLQTIAGVGPDKAERFGTSILNLCNA